MAKAIICKCGTRTINPKGPKKDQCVNCWRAFRRTRYNPPVPKSRFDASEFSSCTTSITEKAMRIAETCRRSNELMKMSFRQIGQINFR